MAGRLNKKEKEKAVSGLRRWNRPAVMVLPEREMPGTMAKAWNRPMMNEFGGVSLAVCF